MLQRADGKRKRRCMQCVKCAVCVVSEREVMQKWPTKRERYAKRGEKGEKFHSEAGSGVQQRQCGVYSVCSRDGTIVQEAGGMCHVQEKCTSIMRGGTKRGGREMRREQIGVRDGEVQKRENHHHVRVKCERACVLRK